VHKLLTFFKVVFYLGMRMLGRHVTRQGELAAQMQADG
jgi:hypothetical protein